LGGGTVRLTPDWKIEHWKEYVEYGYRDWVAAMGGIFSLVSVIYFGVANRIAVHSGSLSMGILPAMSGVSRNVEEIRIIKDRLQKVEIKVEGPQSWESAL